MKAAIAGIGIAPASFSPKEGGVYALACERMDVFKATEYAHRFLQTTGVGRGEIVTERFSFRHDASQDRLGKELEALALSAFPCDGAVVVLPGISKQELAPAGDCDKADVLAFCFELRRQLEGCRHPCFVPVQSVGLCVDYDWVLDALSLAGFTTIRIWAEATDATPVPYMGDWIAKEAASMATFPDSVAELEGDEQA